MKVLVAVDSSKTSFQAFEHACKLVNPEKDELHILSIWDPIPYYTAPRSAGMFSAANKQVLNSTKKMMKVYREKAEKKNLKPYCVIATGEPGPQICSLCKERNIDLLVVGRTGINAFERFMLGSVSEYCTKYSPCTVMVIKYDPEKYEQEIVRGSIFLAKTVLCEAISGRPPIIAQSTDTVKHALELMTENNIVSLPVFDQNKGTFISFIDMTEIANFAMELDAENLPSLICQEKFENQTLNDLAVNAASRLPYLALDCEVTLLSVVDFMSKKNLKRIAVQDDSGELLGILTQSQLLSFILSKMEKFDFGSKTVGQLNLGIRPVISVQKNKFVKDAFKILKDNHVTGIVILDDQQIVGNISVSDFKFANHLNIRGYLNMIIEDFVNIKPLKIGNIISPICVRLSTTIYELLEKIRLTRVHRLYVLGDDNKLVGVITLSDIINLIVEDQD